MKYVKIYLLAVLLVVFASGCKENSRQKDAVNSDSVSQTNTMAEHGMNTEKTIIAHRGASGYLPEHTIASKVMAYYMGVPFIEQDLAMTKDNQLVVIHDHYLDRVTDVAEKYPDKARSDGRYYVIDFTLDEIKKLSFMEGFEVKDGKKVQVFPDRFPMGKSTFEIHTLAEEIELIQGLNKVFGKDVGLYVETKAPWFHKQEGKDISKATLEVLKKYGYTTKDSNVYFQTFDFPDLVYVKEKLMPEMGMDLKTVMLYAYNDWNETYEQQKDGSWTPFDFDKIKTKEGMKIVSKYADGAGPAYDMIIDEKNSQKGNIIITDFVKNAHDNGMIVHPYTVRKDKLPPYVDNVFELYDIILYKAGADGVFTDFPDLGMSYVAEQKNK